MRDNDAYRERFLSALAQNEDDRETRLVYADWLEEQGEYEEAERQRAWPAAKDRIMALLTSPDLWGVDDWVMGYRSLIERARESVGDAQETGYFEGFSCGSDMDLQEKLNQNSKQFWDDWSIVTGIPLPKGLESERTYFSCSC